MGLSRICEFLSSESLPFVVALASPLVRHTFEGTLTADDSKRYLNNAFEVPDGVERLELKLEFAPLRVSGIGNMLTLSVYDPAGSRGAGHRGGAEHRVFITRYSASPAMCPDRFRLDSGSLRLTPISSCPDRRATTNWKLPPTAVQGTKLLAGHRRTRGFGCAAGRAGIAVISTGTATTPMGTGLSTIWSLGRELIDWTLSH